MHDESSPLLEAEYLVIQNSSVTTSSSATVNSLIEVVLLGKYCTVYKVETGRRARNSSIILCRRKTFSYLIFRGL